MSFKGDMKMALQKIQVSVILVVGALVAVSALVSGLLIASQTIPNTGNVKAVGVGVYSDSACTQEVQLIQWGILDPGESSDKTVYIRNEGNVAVVLNMATENWDPALASTYITLGWNLEQGYVLSHGQSVETVLTLSVSSSISGVESFTFDIIITGTEST
jgi:hypothetical protein